MVNFHATKKELEVIGRVCDKAEAQLAKAGMSRMDLMMDLEATHSNGCPLDFTKLLRFKDFDFYHDIYGIIKHLDRDTGKLQDCFVPRCSS